MRHQDGTHPSDPAAVRALSDEDRHFLEQALQEYSQAGPADEHLNRSTCQQLYVSSQAFLSVVALSILDGGKVPLRIWLCLI